MRACMCGMNECKKNVILWIYICFSLMNICEYYYEIVTRTRVILVVVSFPFFFLLYQYTIYIE
jgi:hypothetical protein